MTTVRRAMAAMVGVAGLIAGANPAFAAGFAVAEQGAASVGVAGAATARSDLPETAFYNPAATPAGLQVAAGVAVIVPNVFHEHPPTGVQTEAASSAATPPYLHAGWVGEFDSHRAGLLFVGNVPFGSGLAWPEDWAGRFEVTAIELQVFESSANLVYGLALNEDLDLGFSGSVRAMRSTVGLERKIDAVEREASVELGGVANALGFGAAGHARFGDASLGVNFRSAAPLSFDGAAHFENVPPELSGAAHDQGVTTAITLPERLAFGAAYRLWDGTISAELVYFRWSRFETFAIDFEDEATPDVAEPRNWHDTMTLRGGYEHRFLSEALAVRAGAAFDPTPSPTDTLGPTLPDSTRIVGTIGLGYQFEFGLRLDASYAHFALLGASSTGEDVFPGNYGGFADLVSFGVSYRR